MNRINLIANSLVRFSRLCQYEILSESATVPPVRVIICGYWIMNRKRPIWRPLSPSSKPSPQSPLIQQLTEFPISRLLIFSWNSSLITHQCYFLLSSRFFFQSLCKSSFITHPSSIPFSYLISTPFPNFPQFIIHHSSIIISYNSSSVCFSLESDFLVKFARVASRWRMRRSCWVSESQDFWSTL